MIVHKICKTEVETIFGSSSIDSMNGQLHNEITCYNMCPRCNIQLFLPDLIIGYEDGKPRENISRLT